MKIYEHKLLFSASKAYVEVFDARDFDSFKERKKLRFVHIFDHDVAISVTDEVAGFKNIIVYKSGHHTGYTVYKNWVRKGERR